MKSGKLFRFQVGVGKVIKGWDQGLIGMKPNGERKLTIPADLAYGSRAMGDTIPANSDLKFTIKLSKVLPSAKITVLTEGKGEPMKIGQLLDCKLSVKPSNGREMADPTKESRLALSPQMLPWINQALAGIKAGEKRKVIISYEMAFGEKGYPAADEKDKKAGSLVPPKSDLTLEIEALKIIDDK
jgi:FKBP-type peptidyl-prolyl cis-trans isomerase